MTEAAPKKAPRKTTRKKAPAKAPVQAAPEATPNNGGGNPQVMDANGVVGEIAPEVRERIAQFQNQTREVTHQIGQLEVRKSQLLAALQDINMQAQALVNAEAKRLGIPDGMPWQITGDGKARLMVQGPGQGQPPAGG